MELGIRILWLTVGLLSVAIGALGVVLPILPTTPFLLVGAFAFARSSERLNLWLTTHRIFGPLIDNWHRYRSIDSKTKRTAIVIIILTPIAAWFFDAPLWVIGCQIIVLSGAAIFIVTRPLPPQTMPSQPTR